MTEYTNLKEKVAIVSGGGTGIGLAIALALASHGAGVVICGRRMDRLDNARASLAQSGADCLAVQTDVSKEREVEGLIRSTLEHFGRVDILVNNAAIYEEVRTYQIDPQAWERVLAVNLRGPMLMTQAVLPLMRSQQSGHILNISSESGLSYYEGDAAYGLSKHALNDFGEYVQRENQDYNIRVNTICPGMVITEMTTDSPGLDQSRCLYPEDIADLAIWLLTRRENVKIGTPILIQTMMNPWE